MGGDGSKYPKNICGEYKSRDKYRISNLAHSMLTKRSRLTFDRLASLSVAMLQINNFVSFRLNHDLWCPSYSLAPLHFSEQF